MAHIYGLSPPYQQLKAFSPIAFYLIPTDNFDWKSQIPAEAQSFQIIFSPPVVPLCRLLPRISLAAESRAWLKLVGCRNLRLAAAVNHVFQRRDTTANRTSRRHTMGFVILNARGCTTQPPAFCFQILEGITVSFLITIGVAAPVPELLEKQMMMIIISFFSDDWLLHCRPE